MKKFNEIKNSPQFGYLVSIMDKLKSEQVKRQLTESFLTQLTDNIQEFAGYPMMEAYRFKQAFDVILDYSEKFYDCKDHGMSYFLGCRYQKIDFDYADNIDSEITFLKSLLEVYNEKFEKERILIKSLITDLHTFKDAFMAYEVS